MQTTSPFKHRQYLQPDARMTSNSLRLIIINTSQAESTKPPGWNQLVVPFRTGISSWRRRDRGPLLACRAEPRRLSIILPLVVCNLWTAMSLVWLLMPWRSPSCPHGRVDGRPLSASSSLSCRCRPKTSFNSRLPLHIRRYYPFLKFRCSG